MSEKSISVELKEKLFYERKNGRLTADDATLSAADEYCEGYKNYLNLSKTEREAAKVSIEMAKEKGFKPFELGKSYAAGEKLYINIRG